MNIERVIDIVRQHRLDEMMTVGAGGIAGTAEAGDDPPVDLRRGKARGWNIFFKGLVKSNRKKKKKKNV
jgi:hypothetical protein